jgi:hypothetical protein
MKFEAIIADGRLISSDNDELRRNPNHLLIQCFTAGGVYRVTGDIDGQFINSIEVTDMVAELEKLPAMAAELAAYKEQLQKLKKNLRPEGDDSRKCECEHPNFRKTTATRTGKICLTCGGVE